MKSVGTTINFERSIGLDNEIKNITEKVISLHASFVDEVVVKALYEAYKDTEISKIFVVDLNNFKDFLYEMLPQWLATKEYTR